MVSQSIQAADSHKDNQIAERQFYATHSIASTPGQYAHLLDTLPRDFVAISHVVQGLMFHYMAGPHMYGYQPPKERMAEIDTRFMERMLARIIEMDSRPLSEPRDIDKRLIGCCRDFSLLTCAILRQHGIPARSRYGFANYFFEGYWVDHVIVEAWNGTDWQRFDPQVTDGSAKMTLSEAEFITGGRAWQMVRDEGADPAKFGLGPDAPELSGTWFVRSRLLLDVASLNKQELLCWDQWGGWSSREDRGSAEEEALLAEVATLTAQSDMGPLRAFSAAHGALYIPESVICFSPAVGEHPASIR